MADSKEPRDAVRRLLEMICKRCSSAYALNGICDRCRREESGATTNAQLLARIRDLEWQNAQLRHQERRRHDDEVAEAYRWLDREYRRGLGF